MYIDTLVKERQAMGAEKYDNLRKNISLGKDSIQARGIHE